MLYCLQNTVRSTSANSERPINVCRQCHKTCLVSNNNADLEATNGTDINANAPDAHEFSSLDDTSWGPFNFLSSVLSPSDPFNPVPHISVLPPSPPTSHETSPVNNNFWEDAELSSTMDSTTVTPKVSFYTLI